ncbi:MAG: HAMP domain-containing protein [Myxococcales bacterium]
MTEHLAGVASGAGVRLRHSVFTKLMAVMVGMGFVIPTVVATFFVLLVQPTVDRSAQGLLTDYLELFAATAPDLEAARKAAAQHGMEIRYEGPKGSWATDEKLPAIGQVTEELNRPWGGGYHVVARPDGGRYLFSWNFHSDLQSAHDRMLLLLLSFLVFVVFFGHWLLKRALRPLVSLSEGVAALGEGNLDVVVPSKTKDEFGELTAAFNRMVGRVREMVQSRNQLLLDVSHEPVRR